MEKIGTYKELGHTFNMYGTIENPLFSAVEIGKIIDYSIGNVTNMIKCVDEHEKILVNVTALNNVKTGSKRVGNYTTPKWFLTEYGLYEVLFQSRKPIAKLFKLRVKLILKKLRLYGKVEEEFDFGNMFIPIDIQEGFQSHNDLLEDLGRDLWTLEEYLDTIGMMIDPTNKRIVPKVLDLRNKNSMSPNWDLNKFMDIID